jgi:flagellar biosynthetic protein FliR
VEALLPYAYGYLIVLFRCTGLVMVAPGLGSRVVPARIRLAAATAFALAAWAGSGAAALPVPETLAGLFVQSAREGLVGIAGGIGAAWVLEAATSAGHIAGITMGLGYGAQISPLTGADSPALGQLIAMAALATAVALGVHREALLWLCRSLQAAPAGGAVDLRSLGAQALGQGILGMGLGARVAFPILIAVTSGHFALGLAGKFAPQISLQSIGFSVALLAGGAAVYLFGPQASELVARAAVAALTH